MVTRETPERRSMLAGLLGIAALTAAARAGPLNPPAGPISPTAKPLGELEPRTAVNAANTPGDGSAAFVISQPGSYYLLGDVVVPANKTGIRVDAPDVTLDLNGFRILGNNTAGTTGVTAISGLATNLTIRNGTIESMNNYGVAIIGDGPYRITDVTVRSNRGYGVLTSGPGRVERVAAIENAAGVASSPAGMFLGSDTSVTGCVAASNNGKGIATGGNALIMDCVAYTNSADGISAGPTAVVVGCESSHNGGAGLSLQHSGVVDSCAARQNAGAGIIASFGSVVRRSHAVDNSGSGISVWEGCLVAGCVSQGNTGDGFVLNTGGVIRGCTATSNTAAGINTGAAVGSVVHACTASQNFDGIVVGPGCLVRGNHAETHQNGPGSAGIRVTGVSSRLVGNLCSRGGLGMMVAAAKTLIQRNDCSENTTNWNIAASCVYGPVVNIVAPGSGTMSGNGTVASTLASADPFANFSF